MSIPVWTRYQRRLIRRLKLHLAYLRITLNGNQVPKQMDFHKPNLKPVLLIQGFGSTRLAFSVLEKRLRQDGFDVFSLKLGGLFGTLNTRGIHILALEIQRRLQDLRRRFGMGRVHIIGHSKGGVIGRYLISCLNGEADVQSLTTLGTPHQGWPSARFFHMTPLGWLSRGLRDLRPTSPVMRQIQCKKIPSTVSCLSITSTGDRVVPHLMAQLHDAGARTICLERISHSDYLLKQSVYELIRDHLKSVKG